ncbi:MAG: phosphate acyltransferase PlsX [Bacilli bacterium]|nr:phosphate acyltransferase PlsX [Bacilli bacterium]
MIKIIVDTLGADRGYGVMVDGAIQAINNNSDIHIILVGPKDKLEGELKKYTYNSNNIEIVNATDEITCNDKPTEAIKKKLDSSLVKSFDILRENDDINCLVSAGSTGAILTGAVLKVGRIKGVKRPAFCPILPTMIPGKIVAICDSGANADCDPHYLQQFGIMGSLYLNTAYNIDKPKVALLNIGTEEEKGDILRKQTFQLLKETNNINFVGNMESRDLLTGEYDLVVCDGFSGNVLLKSTEGACLEMLKLLKRTFTKSFKNKIGALLLKKDIYEIKDFMDYNNYGGAVMLGVNKTIVKGHGSTKALSIFHSINLAYKIESNNLREKIAREIKENTLEEKEA